MSRRLSRILLALVFLMSAEVWALGLGDIKLDSALNEPLRAEIQLLSATPEELDNLTIALASEATFSRYGLDRPFYLQGLQFQVVRSGRTDGNVVQVRSAAPMTEPFLTFLVEASWSRGRLLREYTVLLDPPTFAPPAATPTAPAVTAPTRSEPADSGRIERPAAAAPAPSAPPVQSSRPAPAPRSTPPPVVDDSPFDTAAGGDYRVQRSETLWGIAQRVRPDSRLSMNQTMLAIYEANPQAFGGNINILRAGASLRIPSADEIFRITRSTANSEVARQHQQWQGGSIPPADRSASRPDLTLVPPDDDYASDEVGTDPLYDDQPLSREEEVEQRIAEIEAEPVPAQQSLIDIRNNELARLRQELANIRGEVYEPPVEEVVDDTAIEDPFVDTDAVDLDGDGIADDEIMVDDSAADAPADDAAAPADDADIGAAEPAEPVADRTPARSEPGIVDRAMEFLSSFWIWIIGAVAAVLALLVWFMRRGGDDADEPEAWQALDADEMDQDTMSATESLKAPSQQDESFVVVEQDSGLRGDDTVETPAPEIAAGADAAAQTGEFGSLEDTFSSDTALNLDQSDPVAEADFHMAYGLYDQAADLINGALSVEPERTDLLAKLCEIYFVWGNRDAFIDAAGQLKSKIGDGDSAEWDKTVIMGQQIAGDDALFAGAAVAGATKAVDLSFEAGMDETGSLDMELVSDAGAASDVFDLGGGEEPQDAGGDDGLDFMLDEAADDTAESPTLDTPDFDITAEMPAADSTLETPTIEQQFEGLGDGTAELPSLDEAVGDAIESSGQSADATAEINLDDLGLDLSGLDETEVASLDDLDATSETAALSASGIEEALDDPTAVTGRNPEIDPNATGVQAALSDEDTGINEALSNTDVDLDSSLLDATGVTQVLSDDLAVDTLSDVGEALGDDDATMLAPGYGEGEATVALGADEATTLAGLDDEQSGDFDFAKTEALPAEVFTGDASLDETGELPAVASTDVDLDLDDLTAALQVSEMGDTIEQMRDDATVEQPRPDMGDAASATVALEPDELSDDLTDARTMTEVGTKLDLARAYVDMGDPAGARSILEEVLDEGDDAQRQQAQSLLDSLPS